MEDKTSQQKVSNAKTHHLEKQLADFTKKLQDSENARKKLTYEI